MCQSWLRQPCVGRGDSGAAPGTCSQGGWRCKQRGRSQCWRAQQLRTCRCLPGLTILLDQPEHHARRQHAVSRCPAWCARLRRAQGCTQQSGGGAVRLGFNAEGLQRAKGPGRPRCADDSVCAPQEELGRSQPLGHAQPAGRQLLAGRQVCLRPLWYLSEVQSVCSPLHTQYREEAVLFSSAGP